MWNGPSPIGPGFNPLAKAVTTTVGPPVFITVEGTAEAPFIIFGGKRVDLAANRGLQPGQELSATMVPKGGGFELQLEEAPSPSAAPPASAPPAPPQANAGSRLGGVLAQLARMGEPADLAALLPPMPPSDAAVRNLVTLFRQAESLGPRLQQLTTMLRGVLHEGHPMLAVLVAMSEEFAGLQSGDPARVARALRNFAENRLPEATLGQATATELSALKNQDLATALQTLRDTPALRAALEQAGLLDAFVSGTDEVLQRIDGARGQQLHGTMQGYTFLELPLPADSGFRHAMLHLYHEGNAKGPDAHKLPSVAVLDLNMDNLGPIWLELRGLSGTCQCTLLATLPETRALLDEHRADVAQALEEAGFAKAQVRTGPWDGDRIARTGTLLAGFRPLDVQG